MYYKDNLENQQESIDKLKMLSSKYDIKYDIIDLNKFTVSQSGDSISSNSTIVQSFIEDQVKEIK